MRFFLIDRITVWQPGTLAEGLKNVALSEDFFDDHFPRRPVMPGVLILEGIAQLSGLLLEAGLEQRYGRTAKAVLTLIEKTRFRALVRPGDTLLYRTEVSALNDAGGKVRAEARRGTELIATTELGFAFKTVDDAQLETRRRALLELWLR